MNPSVCAACGHRTDEVVIAPEEPELICAACDHRQRFARLPLLALTGASGAGKSTVGGMLAGRLERCLLLDQDLLWLPDQLDPADDHRQFRRLWLRMAAAVHQNGQSVMLCGTVIPGQLESCPERNLIGAIHYLALVCSSAELGARLTSRPVSRSGTDSSLANMLAFNEWIRDNAATTTPPMQLLDNSGLSIQVTTAAVEAWALNILERTTRGVAR